MKTVSGGIFWIKNPNDIAGSAICVERTNDSNRWRHMYENNAVFVEGISHKEIWEQLPETETNGEEYNCYPRGRVQIKSGAATIYANPSICTEELKTFITETFRLYPQFHISEVRMKADGSKHYECYSDKQEKTKWKMQKKQ